MNVMEIKGITKDYGQNKGVFDISFSVAKGEIMGFLGPNGAGKTTTIRQLMGFTRPDKGTISIYGDDCFKNAAKIQKNLGYLPGEIAFLEDMTGIDFINFVAGMRGLKDMRYANDLMKFFELDAKGKIKKMSKGMKQKIAIICAFMHNPQTLILDEPTSGLDPLMQSRFIDLINAEKLRGKTILMSSHTFEEVERTCDRSVIIRAGRIVAVENMVDLRRSKRKIFEVQFVNEIDAVRFVHNNPNYEATINGDTVTMITINEVDHLVKALSVYQILDLRVHPQTLEEIFMHFYGGGQVD